MAGLALVQSTPSGAGNLGGVLPMRSLQQTLLDGTPAAAPPPVMSSLAAHIRRCWEQAKIAKLPIERKMLSALRAKRGEYDPDLLAKIRQQGGSEIYMMLFATKARQAKALLADTIIGTGSEKPWTLAPTPEPDLPPDQIAECMREAQQRVEQMHLNGMPPTQDEVREMLEDLRDSAVADMQDEAKEMVARMERHMEDQLNEGGFLGALDKFLDDLTTYKTAFLKGPVVRKRFRLKWVRSATGWTMQTEPALVLEWDRVDPLNIYPAPHSSSVQDGFLIERHKMERGGLQALRGVEGYKDSEIAAVLDEYGRGGLHEWLQVDTERASIEGKQPAFITTNDLIDALQFWGRVQGRVLLEWGVEESSIPDPMAEYSIEAWLVGTHVIKASINPDPLQRRPYYADSYERVPGAFWGNSLFDLVDDCQNMCNSAARALANNLGIASGPQVGFNVDRLPPGETLTQMFPWKLWQFTSDPMGSTQPAMQFFQPESHAAELMQVYERFSMMADEYSGIPRYMTGSEGTPGAGRTASGLSMMIGNATKTIKKVVSSIDINVLTPLLEMLYYYNMRYGTDEEMKGDVNIVARGAMSLITKESAQVRRNEFLQITANPIDMQIIGVEGRAAVLREVAKTLDMNVDKVVPTVAALAAKARAVQAQAAPVQAAQVGPGQTLMNGSPVTDTFQPA
jgi:hypothetical protein